MGEDEANTVAKAYLDMQRHYGGIVSGKTLDTMRFCMVLATVYGGRMVAINMRKREEKTSGQKQPPKAPPTLHVVKPVPTPTPTVVKQPVASPADELQMFNFNLAAGGVETSHE